VAKKSPRAKIEQILNRIGYEGTGDIDVVVSVAALRRMAASAEIDFSTFVLGGNEKSAAYATQRQQNIDLQAALTKTERALRIAQQDLERLYEKLDQLTAAAGFGRANAARSTSADVHARRVRKIIDEIVAQHGPLSNEDISAELMRRAILTPSGGKTWVRAQVRRVLERTHERNAS
jgi:hypothetical protein